MYTSLRLAAVAAIGAAMFVAPASAVPVTVNGSCTALGFNPTELSGNVSCDTFDQSAYGGASLISMTLQITGAIDGTIVLTTGASASTNQIGQTNSRFFLTSALAGFAFPVGVPPLGSSLFTVSANTGAPVSLPANSSTSPLPVNGSNQTANLTNNSALAGYETVGFGSFLIPIETNTSLEIFGSGGNLGGNQVTSAQANALVTYTYDDGTVKTPEPASLAMLGMGMLALGALRRRR